MSVHAICDECDTECDDADLTVLCSACAKDATPSGVRGWLAKERAKPASDITPEIAAIFERCAEDLE